MQGSSQHPRTSRHRQLVGPHLDRAPSVAFTASNPHRQQRRPAVRAEPCRSIAHRGNNRFPRRLTHDRQDRLWPVNNPLADNHSDHGKLSSGGPQEQRSLGPGRCVLNAWPTRSTNGSPCICQFRSKTEQVVPMSRAAFNCFWGLSPRSADTVSNEWNTARWQGLRRGVEARTGTDLAVTAGEGDGRRSLEELRAGAGGC